MGLVIWGRPPNPVVNTILLLEVMIPWDLTRRKGSNVDTPAKLIAAARRHAGITADDISDSGEIATATSYRISYYPLFGSGLVLARLYF